MHVISWIIVIGLLAGGYYLFSKTDMFSGSEGGTVSLNAHAKGKTAAAHKKAQAHRYLPKKYSAQLVKQSEEKAMKKLESQLVKFKEMSQKMRKRRDDLLTQVENRRLPAGAPSNANDTREARAIKAVQAGDVSSMSVEEIYNLLREYEQEIQSNHIAVSAAKQAMSRGQSFPEVYRSLKSNKTPGMPDYEHLLAMNGQNGGDGISSTADLNNYRDILSNANRQAGLAASRLSNLFGAGRTMRRPGAEGMGPGGEGGQNGNQGPGGGGEGGSGGGKGDGFGNGETSGDDNDGYAKAPLLAYSGSKINADMAQAQALPGRRFSKDAKRSGWLYVNTWYMIGPWESYGRNDFSIIHPPELSIDFDAVYTDGQRGKGTEEVDAHPTKMIGREVYLDGTLRWKFMQSESIHNVVPVTTGHSTYYAYTELYFDEATTMLVAIGTDDSGRVWINDKDVWQDTGTSWYNIDEHIAPFKFRQGWNKILIRLENGGGGACGFSFLLIPT